MQSYSAFAALLLILTIGVGIAEAWHTEEHVDERSCAECVLCSLVTQGPIAAGGGGSDRHRPDALSRRSDGAESAPHVPRERRPDAARAPPA